MSADAARDWEGLGKWVHEARLRAGFTTSKDWAKAVGRSTRQLLGLERGEPVGDGTIAAVADALRQPAADLYAVLAGEDVPVPRRFGVVVLNSDSPDAQPILEYTKLPGVPRLLVLDAKGEPVPFEDQVRFAEVVRGVLAENPEQAGALLAAAAEAFARLSTSERAPTELLAAADEEPHEFRDEQGHDETP